MFFETWLKQNKNNSKFFIVLQVVKQRQPILTQPTDREDRTGMGNLWRMACFTLCPGTLCQQAYCRVDGECSFKITPGGSLHTLLFF